MASSSAGQPQTTSLQRSITFKSKGQPSLLLEGVLHSPAHVEHAPLIVLCHPQPASSDMNDVLTVALAQQLAASGMIALRFNFRGVGNSQGQQTEGRMEPLDLTGPMDTILEQTGGHPDKCRDIGQGF